MADEVKVDLPEKEDGPNIFDNGPEVPHRSQEELSLEFSRLRAARTCENLAGKISYLYTASRMVELAELFAEQDDTEIRMPYGIYRGKDAAKRCFVDDLTDRDTENEERLEDIKGRMVIRDFCSAIVEVAGDCKTAKGLWVVPGLEAHPDGKGNAQGYWSWCRIALDFILNENGDWKIWHYAQYNYFASEYERSWANSPKFIFEPKRNSSDAPAEVGYYYTTEGVYPDSEPEPPLPYDTWDK